MADYYNKTRGPLAVTLRRGGSMSVGPKAWCFIEAADEGSESLTDLVRKGFLVRSLVPQTNPTPADTSPQKAVIPVEKVVEPTANQVNSEAPTSTAPKPSVELKQSRRNK